MAFQKGQSGNPNGRPKGAFTKKTHTEMAIDKLNQAKGIDAVSDLVTKLYEVGMTGDVQAINAILARLDPISKNAHKRVDTCITATDSLDKAKQLLDLILCGDIAADIGKEMITSLGLVLSAQEKSELEARLEKLEASNNGNVVKK